MTIPDEKTDTLLDEVATIVFGYTPESIAEMKRDVPGWEPRHALADHQRSIVAAVLAVPAKPLSIADRKSAQAWLRGERHAAWVQGMRTGSSRAMRMMSDEPTLALASEADSPYAPEETS